MTAMSNDQWGKDQRAAASNNDPGQAQGQPSGGEWGQGGDTSSTQNWDQPSQQPQQPQGQQGGGAWAAAQGQPRQEYSQPHPGTQEWNTGAQEQTSANEWTTGAQQQTSASEWHGAGQQWNTQGQPGGNQGGAGWNQNPQGNFAPGQQWQQQPPKEPTGLGNLFDLSFKRFVLPSGGGVLFMVIAIGLLIKWLFDLIWTLSYGPDIADLMQVLLGELAVTFVYILLTRAFLEGMSALVSMSTKNKDSDGS